MARKATPITPTERRAQIACLASSAGLASIDELSTRYGVTASTIRRDLAKLVDKGTLARTYGGAIALEGLRESSLREREIEEHSAKTALAQWALKQITDGGHLLFDGGSTVGELARAIRRTGGPQELWVTAIGLNVVTELSDVDGIEMVSPGGVVRRSSQSFVGPFTETALTRMTFDQGFLSSDGVTANDGLCEASPEQTRLKELMAGQCVEVYVLADSSKLGQRPFHSWARIPLPWTLVTDDGADERQVDLFRRSGVQVEVVANMPPPSNAG